MQIDSPVGVVGASAGKGLHRGLRAAYTIEVDFAVATNAAHGDLSQALTGTRASVEALDQARQALSIL